MFLKIIHGCINKNLKKGTDNSQFGFRNWVDTKAALLAINVLTQRCMDANADMHVWYIDFEKAFNRKTKLVEILQTQNIDKRDLKIIWWHGHNYEQTYCQRWAKNTK